MHMPDIASIVDPVNEANSVKEMLDLGFTLGPIEYVTVEQRRSGHFGCTYHVLRDGEPLDGGTAEVLLSFFRDGHFGKKPRGLELRQQVNHPLNVIHVDTEEYKQRQRDALEWLADNT